MLRTVVSQLFLVISLTTFVTPVTLGYSEDAPANQIVIASQPHADTRSAEIELERNQSITAKVESLDAAFDADIYVFKAADKELVGMTNHDAEVAQFDWTAPEDGKYYIVLRNNSAASGKCIVTIIPKGSRGKVGGELPTAAIETVYYATERQRTNTDKTHASYGPEPAKDRHIEYGKSCVRIPHDHRMGELESQTISSLTFEVDKDTGVVLNSVVSESKEQFFNEIKAAPEKQVLVFVHGFNQPFEEALRRAGQLKYDLGFPGSMVLYSWPSEGGQSLLNLVAMDISYKRDAENAKLSVPNFQQFLLDLTSQTGIKTIHVLAHSMGNRVAVGAIAGMAAQPAFAAVHFQHVALMAPDIDTREFIQMAKALKSSAADVTLYASSSDLALKASEKIAGYSRAGEGGDHLVVLPGVIQTIDASQVDLDVGNKHGYYADNSTILGDLFYLMKGEMADSRFGLIKIPGKLGEYWIFRPSTR